MKDWVHILHSNMLLTSWAVARALEGIGVRYTKVEIKVFWNNYKLCEKRKCEFSVIFHLKKNERNTDIENKLYERQIKN